MAIQDAIDNIRAVREADEFAERRARAFGDVADKFPVT